MSTATTEAAPSESCPMQRPGPAAENAWLDQLIGTWESEVELSCGPGTPTFKNTGTETVRGLNGFWIVSEVASLNPEIPYLHLFTIGFDTAKGKYVGTRVDNMMGKLWIYEGTVEGNTLVLECETECPMTPGTTRLFRETLEIVDNDTKNFSTSMRMDDGTWSHCVTGSARRVK